MELNVSASTGKQLENSEVLRNTAKNILAGKTNSENVQKIIENVWSESNLQMKEIYSNAQLNVLKASSQITLNESLKETIKYLKSHAGAKKYKTPVFGELWNIISINNEASEKNPYKGELCDFVIDIKAKNIFAA